ncbi:MAG: septal ring lytic transglycosylase RlpA family protein [Nitrosomonas sp.]
MPLSFFYYSRKATVLIFILISGCAVNSIDKGRSKHTNISTPNLNAAYNKAYTVFGVTYYPLKTAVGYSETGYASWYGAESGNTTAMGTYFNPNKMTAAHKTLPLPSRVRVTNLQNGRQIVVVVNDRGPFKRNRIIDLSRSAAKNIGIEGVSRVKVEYVGGN